MLLIFVYLLFIIVMTLLLLTFITLTLLKQFFICLEGINIIILKWLNLAVFTE